MYFSRNKYLVYLVLLYSCIGREFVPNPCAKEKPSTADFIIEQKVGDRWFKSDTIISSQFNLVRFTSVQESVSYSWSIGTETISNRSFEKRAFPDNSNIPVRLVTTTVPNNECFPDDDGIDTTIKLLHVWPQTYGFLPGDVPSDTTVSPYLPIYGTYYGESTFEKGRKKYVTIIDTVWTDDLNRTKRVGLIRGIPYQSLTTKHQRNSSLYKYIDDVGLTALHFNMKTNVGGILGTPTIPIMEGYAWLDEGNWNKITIEYKFLDTATQQWKEDFFEGVRVW